MADPLPPDDLSGVRRSRLAWAIIPSVIRSFRHKGLRLLFERGTRSGVSAHLAERLLRQMDFLHRARAPSDMNIPGWRLHQLKGELRGTWSVTVSGNWRLTFRFEGEDALDVNLEDYR